MNPKEKEFEEHYIKLRRTEHRIYSDEEVRRLPRVNKTHIHYKEWLIREDSCKRLIRYLSEKNRSLKILEVGCGNGWLSHQLSKIRYSNVVGLDINEFELEQAERIFRKIPTLNFFHGPLDSKLLEYEKFDVIVFAASLQYFNSFAEIIETAFDRLNANGEIHIIDTHFYSENELERARLRSKLYFESNDSEEMDAFYFHHSLSEIKLFDPVILFDPGSVAHKIFGKKNPFYWVCFKK